MAALPFFVRTRKLKTAKWAKKVHSQFHPKNFGCQPKNIFSIPASEHVTIWKINHFHFNMNMSPYDMSPNEQYSYQSQVWILHTKPLYGDICHYIWRLGMKNFRTCHQKKRSDGEVRCICIGPIPILLTIISIGLDVWEVS